MRSVHEKPNTKVRPCGRALAEYSKILLGASLKVKAPTGQYDPTKLINWGANRWGFKPEFGYSQRSSGKWILDAYAGVWLFTTNSDFWSRNIYYPGTRSQSESLRSNASSPSALTAAKPNLATASAINIVLDSLELTKRYKFESPAG
jgi:hypothetical protein